MTKMQSTAEKGDVPSPCGDSHQMKCKDWELYSVGVLIIKLCSRLYIQHGRERMFHVMVFWVMTLCNDVEMEAA